MVIQQGEKQEVFTFAGEKISRKMGIANAAWIIEILSKKLYSRPIYTIIQEYLSNGYDANVKNGAAEQPIIMSLRKNIRDQWYVAFTDFGVGMSETEIFETFAQYGASTKQGSEDEIGMMGLGSKSAFSYTSQFFVKTVKDGVLTEYLVKKIGVGEQEIYLTVPPTITDLPNGTIVSLFIETHDVNSFVEAAKDRAAFFPNIIFDFDENLPKIQSKIYTQNTFKYSPLGDRNEVFVLLGKIPYRINWGEVGFNYRIHLPFAIQLSLTDGVFPTPNREDLVYDEHTKEIIRSKISQMCAEIVELTNKNYIVEDWQTYLKTKYNNPYFKLDEHTFEIKNPDAMERVGGIKFLKKECPFLTNLGLSSDNFTENTLIWSSFNTQRTLNSHGKVKKNKNSVSILSNNAVIFAIENGQRFKSRTIDYLKSKYYSKTIVFVEQDIKSFDQYHKIFENHFPEKEDFEVFFKNLRQFQVTFYHALPTLNSVEVPKEFQSTKRIVTRKPRKKSNEVALQRVYWDYNSQGRYKCKKEVSETDTIESLEANYKCVFWGTKHDLDKLEIVSSTISSINVANEYNNVFLVDVRDAEKMKNVPNATHVNNFLSGKHYLANKIVSATILVNEMPQCPLLAKLIEPKWYELEKKLNDIRLYATNKRYYWMNYLKSSEDFTLDAEMEKLILPFKQNQKIFDFLYMFNSSYSDKNHLLEVVKNVMILEEINFIFE